MRASRKKAVLALVGLFVAVYGFWQARSYLSGPQLEVEYPREGERISDERITVKGTAAGLARLTLDGRQIFIDEKGNFEEDFLLASGVSVIEVKGIGKFGTERVIRRMVYRPSSR